MGHEWPVANTGQAGKNVRLYSKLEDGYISSTQHHCQTVGLYLWYSVSHNSVLLVISRDPAGKEKDDFFL